MILVPISEELEETELQRQERRVAQLLAAYKEAADRTEHIKDRLKQERKYLYKLRKQAKTK